MAYINFTNPNDRIKKDWIQIEGKDTDEKRTVIKRTEDVGGVFSKLLREEKGVDAGLLQEELERRGLEVSHDPEMTPNGITVSSAGILIALVNTPDEKDMETIEQAIVAIKGQKRSPTVGEPQSAKREARGRDEVM